MKKSGPINSKTYQSSYPIIDVKPQNRVNSLPFIFRVNCYNFFQTCSFKFRFFAKQISSYKQTFEYEFYITKYSLVMTLSRLISTHPRILALLLTSNLKIASISPPLIFRVNCCIFFQTCSFMYRLFVKQISSYKQIFGYKLDITNNHFVKNIGRLI